MSTQNKCGICGRHFYTKEGRFPVGGPIIHHLIPKQKYRGKKTDAEKILVCTYCHKQLHKLFSNVVLKREFDSLSKIKNSNKVKKFVKWIRKER